MNTVIEHAFAGRNNSIDLELQEDGEPQDLTGLTRATLHLANRNDPAAALILLDSTLHPGVFDWTTRGAEGVLQINGGELATTIGVESHYDVRLTIYDATLVNGLVWAHEKTTGCTGTALQIKILLVPDGIAA